MTLQRRSFWYRDVFYPRIAIARDQAGAIRKLQPGTIVVIMPADRPKSLKFFCPCDCGEVLSVNVMEGAGKAWDVYYKEGRGLSLSPSVWLDAGCQSHFILRDNTARLLFGRMPKMSPTEELGWWSDLVPKEPTVDEKPKSSGASGLDVDG